MKIDQLKSGDCLLVTASEWIGQAISEVEGSPWVHAAMVVEDPDGTGRWVYEMVWPQLKRTAINDWVNANKCSVVPLVTPLDPPRKTQLWQWWYHRLGLWYDIPELFELAPLTWWHRLCIFFHIKGPLSRLQAIAGDGVCSVNVAWAWQRIGLPVTETTCMTPSDIPGQPFLGPSSHVEA